MKNKKKHCLSVILFILLLGSASYSGNDSGTSEINYNEVATRYSLGITEYSSSSYVRLDQKEEIQAALLDGKAVAVRQISRKGKSYIALSLGNHNYSGNFVFLDIQRVSSSENATDLGLTDIANFIAKKSGKKAEELKKTIKASGKAPIHYLDEYAAQQTNPILLVIDEVQCFIKNKPTLTSVALLQEQLKNLRLVIILHFIPQHEEMLRELFRKYHMHKLTPLNVKEVGMLVRKPLKGTGIRFDDEAIKKIYEITGGLPWEINRLCRMILSGELGRKFQKAIYTEKDMSEIAENKMLVMEGAVGSAVVNHYNDLLDILTNQQREFLTSLLLRTEKEIPVCEVPDTINAKQVVSFLLDIDLIRLDTKRNVYKMRSIWLEKILSRSMPRGEDPKPLCEIVF